MEPQCDKGSSISYIEYDVLARPDSVFHADIYFDVCGNEADAGIDGRSDGIWSVMVRISNTLPPLPPSLYLFPPARARGGKEGRGVGGGGISWDKLL